MKFWVPLFLGKTENQGARILFDDSTFIFRVESDTLWLVSYEWRRLKYMMIEKLQKEKELCCKRKEPKELYRWRWMKPKIAKTSRNWSKHYLNAMQSCNETSSREIFKTFNRNRRKVFPHTMIYYSSTTKNRKSYNYLILENEYFRQILEANTPEKSYPIGMT